jgi:hypothetical protein
MSEEVSPESKLYVKEEIDKSRKEIKEEVEKINSKATKTFTTVAMIVGLLTGLSVYGGAKQYMSETINNRLGTDALKDFDDRRSKAEENMKVAEGLLEEILAREKIVHLPIGTILPSMLGPNLFAAIVGDPEGSKWVLADGRPVDKESEYYKNLSAKKVPDLRGVFLRGLDKGGKRDPDGKNRKAGDLQEDAFKKHRHGYPTAGGTKKKEWRGSGKIKVSLAFHQQGFVNIEGDHETRPKNVAVYYYIKIN